MRLREAQAFGALMTAIETAVSIYVETQVADTREDVSVADVYYRVITQMLVHLQETAFKEGGEDAIEHGER
jgi:hypothetical protein